MNRARAKRIACGLVAAQTQAEIGIDAWRDQGLLDEHSDSDQERILAAAQEIASELTRRAGGE